MARLFPGLPAVIDHGAKPDIAGGGFQPWADEMARIADATHWCCKLSGLVTEAGPGWDVEQLSRYVRHLLDCFGAERLMWGSDWPVVDLAGGYAAWRRAAEALVPAAAREAVFGATAVRFYGL